MVECIFVDVVIASLNWNPDAAVDKMNKLEKLLICDALLDQDIFAGVGNKIKDEILFNAKVHPASDIGKVPEKNLRTLHLRKHEEQPNQYFAATRSPPPLQPSQSG